MKYKLGQYVTWLNKKGHSGDGIIREAKTNLGDVPGWHYRIDACWVHESCLDYAVEQGLKAMSNDIPFKVGPIGQAMGVTEDDVTEATRKIEQFGNVTIVMQPNHMAVRDGDRLVIGIGNDDGKFFELSDRVVAVDAIAWAKSYTRGNKQILEVQLKHGMPGFCYDDPGFKIWERLRKAMGLQT